MSADPLSVSGGAGPIVPATFVNPQVQAQIAKSQVSQAADTFGTRPRNEAGPRKASEQTASEPNRQASNIAKAEVRKDEPKHPLQDEPLSLEEAVATFREYLNGLPHDLQFNIDQDTDRTVFKIVNPVTREVVKQYPSDEFLTMVRRLREASQHITGNGLLVDDRF